MAQISAKKLEHTVLAEKDREPWASTPQPPLPKENKTEPSVRSNRSYGGRESRWVRAAAPWREKGGSEREGGLHNEPRQIPRRKGRASNKSLPRTSRRKHERWSGRKSSPGRSAEPWFHSNSGQT